MDGWMDGWIDGWIYLSISKHSAQTVKMLKFGAHKYFL